MSHNVKLNNRMCVFILLNGCGAITEYDTNQIKQASYHCYGVITGLIYRYLGITCSFDLEYIKA